MYSSPDTFRSCFQRRRANISGILPLRFKSGTGSLPLCFPFRYLQPQHPIFRARTLPLGIKAKSAPWGTCRRTPILAKTWETLLSAAKAYKERMFTSSPVLIYLGSIKVQSRMRTSRASHGRGPQMTVGSIFPRATLISTSSPSLWGTPRGRNPFKKRDAGPLLGHRTSSALYGYLAKPFG